MAFSEEKEETSAVMQTTGWKLSHVILTFSIINITNISTNFLNTPHLLLETPILELKSEVLLILANMINIRTVIVAETETATSCVTT